MLTQVIAYLDTGKIYIGADHALPLTLCGLARQEHQSHVRHSDKLLSFGASLRECLSSNISRCFHFHQILTVRVRHPACSGSALDVICMCYYLLVLQLLVPLVGSGKTLVSVLLIKDKAGGLNENGQKRITVFLAPKVLLVQQVLQTVHFALAPSVSTFQVTPISHIPTPVLSSVVG